MGSMLVYSYRVILPHPLAKQQISIHQNFLKILLEENELVYAYYRFLTVDISPLTNNLEQKQHPHNLFLSIYLNTIAVSYCDDKMELTVFFFYFGQCLFNYTSHVQHDRLIRFNLIENVVFYRIQNLKEF